MQKAKSNGKREKKFFFPACQLERARVLGFLAKHLAAMKGNKGSKGSRALKMDIAHLITLPKNLKMWISNTHIYKTFKADIQGQYARPIEKSDIFIQGGFKNIPPLSRSI